MDNSSVTVLDFQFEPKAILLKTHFLRKIMRMKPNRKEIVVGLEDWCKCGKCEPMLTEKYCRCCHQSASYYLNGNIRDGSWNFASSELEIFAINDSRLSGASDCHKGFHV